LPALHTKKEGINAQKIILAIVTTAPLCTTFTFSISYESFYNNSTEYKKAQEIYFVLNNLPFFTPHPNRK